MKRILVTGGAGFIGSYVNALLHRRGYDTLIYDNLSTGNPEMVTAGTFIKGDLRDSKKLKEALLQYPCDGVMHFAASIDAGESVHKPLLYYQNNLYSTLSLLEVMAEVGCQNLIFSSTAAVYGEPQKDLITENHPTFPINPYGRSKLMIEQLLSDVEAAHGIRFICLRYFNAAGADPESIVKNKKPNEHNLIPICLRSLLRNQKITIFGTDYPTPDGTCIRDYIHVHDLGTAHLQGMEKLIDGAPSAIYNLGNGQGFSVREVISAVKETTGKALEFIEGERRAGDPVRLIADASKAEKVLGWKPHFSDLKAIVDHAWKALL